MKKGCRSLMVTANVLLGVFFLPGVFAYCADLISLFISAPKQNEALSGSCLYIPCGFSLNRKHTLDNKGTLYGLWLKGSVGFRQNSNVVVFNSSKTENAFPIKILGDLKQNNCSSLFSNLNTSHSDKYFFRIEKDPFLATAECNSVRINVQDSPQKPWIEISGDVNDLKENQLVTVSCSASTPCPQSPPKLTWNLHQDSLRHTEENEDGSLISKIQHTFNLSHTHDGYSITCSATYPVDGGKQEKTSETQTTLGVSYAPKNTLASISPSGLVPAGSRVELSCSSRAKPPISNFTWFVNTTEGDVKVQEGQVYSFDATQEGFYFCVVKNDLGNQTSQKIQLIIGKTEDSSGLLWTIIGASMGILFLVVCVWLVHFQRKRKVQLSAGEQIPIQTNHEQTVPNLRDNEDQTEEILHYGKVEFTKKKNAAPLFGSAQDKADEETVYAEVKVSYGRSY